VGVGGFLCVGGGGVNEGLMVGGSIRKKEKKKCVEVLCVQENFLNGLCM